MLAGDRPAYEETLRALYADHFERVAELTRDWPSDIRAHFQRLVGIASELHQLALQETAGR